MYTLAKLIQSFFPLMAFICVIIGTKKNAIHYIISALWLSLIAVLIHFQFSGNQVFGTYFNYFNTSIYSCSLLLLLYSLIRIIAHLSVMSPSFKYIYSFVNAFMVVGAFLVIINLWINAFFIEHKREGTPIMQVALLHNSDYCHSKYLFFKVANDNTIMYLCPNYYGLLPSVGRLATTPDFIATQLPLSVKKQLAGQENKT